MLSIDALSYKSLISDCRTIFRIPTPFIVNTIDLLSAANVITCEEGIVSLISEDFQSLLRNYIFANNLVEKISPALISKSDGVLSIDIYRLPNEYIYIHQVLFIAGILDTTVAKSSRYFPIANSCQNEISRIIININNVELTRKRIITPDELDEINKMKADAGYRAELWVFEREIRRLNSHYLINNIKMISQENVSAGFDIASFNTLHSLFYDRFLEVKSYAGSPRIFLSRNELEVAKIYAEKYVLVIVDRNRMSDLAYSPREYINPYKLFFIDARPDWIDIATANYEISFNFKN